MNDPLQEYARSYIKQGLAKCTPEQQRIFRRMYSPTDLNALIDDVVDNMDTDKLDWAMLQVQATLVGNEVENER